MEKPTEREIEGMISIVNAVNCLKKTKEAFEYLRIQFGGKVATELCKKYERHIQWMYDDWTTKYKLRQEVLDVLKDEWNSDVYEVDEIAQKSKLLPAESRATLIQLLDAMIAGETITLLENEG